MKPFEHLLWVIAEESAEVAERASEIAEFGAHGFAPGHDLTYAQRLVGEYADLIGSMELLADEGHIELPDVRACLVTDPARTIAWTCNRLISGLVRACSRTAQRASKIARFGMDEVQPGQPLNNATRLIESFTGVQRIMAELEKEGFVVLSRPDLDAAIDAKKAKVWTYMGYSVKCGTLCHA